MAVDPSVHIQAIVWYGPNDRNSEEKICSACPVLDVQLCLSSSACSVRLPPFCLSCSACPVLLVPFCLSYSAFPDFAFLFCLSCSPCPVLDVLFCLSCSLPVQFCLYSSACPVLSWWIDTDSIDRYYVACWPPIVSIRRIIFKTFFSIASIIGPAIFFIYQN